MNKHYGKRDAGTANVGPLAETQARMAQMVEEIKGMRSAGQNTEASLQQIRAQVAEVATQADTRISAALEKLASTANVPGEVSPRLDTLDAGLRDMVTRIDRMEAAGQRPRAATSHESFGSAIEKHFDQISSVANGNRSSTCRIAVPRLPRAGMRDDAVMGSTELSTLAPRVYRPGVVQMAMDELSLLDIMNEVPAITGDTFYGARWTDQSDAGFAHTLVNGNIDGDPTPKSAVVVDSTRGFHAGAWVRFVNASTLATIQRLRLLTVTDAVTLTFATNAITTDIPDDSICLCETLNVTAEGDTRPAGYLATEEISVSPEAIATYVKVTKQRLAASPGLASYLEEKLKYRIGSAKERQLLYGTGANHQLNGFLNISSLVTLNWSTLNVGDTQADLVSKAASQIPGAHTLWAVLNKDDWYNLCHAKSATDGQYVHTNFGPLAITDQPGNKSIGSVRVVTTNQLLSGSGFVADMLSVSEFVPKAGMAAFELAYDGTDFSNGRVTAGYEESWGHLILDPRSIRGLYFDAAPSA